VKLLKGFKIQIWKFKTKWNETENKKKREWESTIASGPNLVGPFSPISLPRPVLLPPHPQRKCLWHGGPARKRSSSVPRVLRPSLWLSCGARRSGIGSTRTRSSCRSQTRGPSLSAVSSSAQQNRAGLPPRAAERGEDLPLRPGLDFVS
jgi:hypothetical protein